MQRYKKIVAVGNTPMHTKYTDAEQSLQKKHTLCPHKQTVP